MKEFIDQMGRTVPVPATPGRIISLVPSQTELLFDLGLEHRIAGVTKFCIHPADKCKQKPIIGGTKKFDFDLIASLKPDLIIGNKEENYAEGIAQLEHIAPVWMSDIHTLEDSYQMIHCIGDITGTRTKVDTLVNQIEKEFRALQTDPATSLKVLYFIWRDPWMCAGSNTFINDILIKCNLQNVHAKETRYPEIPLEELASLKPDVILLSSEPYPFKERHAGEIRSVYPPAKILFVDGEMFSWYGSRLQFTPAYVKQLRASIETLSQ